MRVLAFDPGYERLGVAVLQKNNTSASLSARKEELVFSDCVRTSANLSFAERLAELGQAVEHLITTHKPTCMALENLYFENNAKTAMNVSAVRGMLLYIAASHALPVYEYTPLQVKVATTGYGKSDKAAVGAMVGRLVALPRGKRLDDELDAIAVGITCLASERLT